MGIKLLSGAWIALQKENVALRDKTRKRFWSEIGVTPAKKVSDIELAPGARMAKAAELHGITKNGKEGDGDLKAVTSLSLVILSQFQPGMKAGFLNESFDFLSNHPEALRKSHFTSEEMTSYEVTKKK